MSQVFQAGGEFQVATIGSCGSVRWPENFTYRLLVTGTTLRAIVPGSAMFVVVRPSGYEETGEEWHHDVGCRVCYRSPCTLYLSTVGFGGAGTVLVNSLPEYRQLWEIPLTRRTTSDGGALIPPPGATGLLATAATTLQPSGVVVPAGVRASVIPGDYVLCVGATSVTFLTPG